MIVDQDAGERLGRIILERETQTRISSFLIGIKQLNAGILGQVEIKPPSWTPFALLQGQFYRELEMIGLLQRVTDWSIDPVVCMRAGLSALRHFGDLGLGCFLIAPFAEATRFYRYLALTHALYAHLRFIPLLPLEVPIEHPYLVLLRNLETIHGQQIQAQIALLRKMPVALSDGEKESIVGNESRHVRDVFRRFVMELTTGG